MALPWGCAGRRVQVWLPCQLNSLLVLGQPSPPLLRFLRIEGVVGAPGFGRFVGWDLGVYIEYGALSILHLTVKAFSSLHL